MKLNPLNLGHLQAQIPIIQGGMGVGISLSSLAGAVAASGGVGLLSSAQIGYADPQFLENPLKANLKALGDHLKKAREKACGGMIGVNIMTATNRYSEYVKQAVQHGADVIISGAGLPVNLPELVQGSRTLIAPVISSLKAARVLLSTWEKRYGRTADFIVVEGPRAGGHLGFKAEDLERSLAFDLELKNIITFIRQQEEKYERSIPVIFGGGVFERSEIDHYLNLGCQGVQIATPFVTTEECDAHDRYKEAYIQAGPADICLIKSPVGMPGRAIRNSFVQRLSEPEPLGPCHHCISKCKRPDIPFCISNRLIAAVNGDVENGLIFCGDNVWRLKEITTVPKLIQKLTDE